MNRLTKKDICYITSGANVVLLRDTVEGYKCCGLAISKLGQLEDIEEELGIDLIILFKALKNGVYYFTTGNQLTKDYVWLVDNYISVAARDKLSYSFRTAFEKQTLLFQDYGKTWALTKEELEND